MFSGLSYGLRRDLSPEVFTCEGPLDAEELGRQLRDQCHGCDACPGLSELLDLLTYRGHAQSAQTGAARLQPMRGPCEA
jgi:hypothetical protein